MLRLAAIDHRYILNLAARNVVLVAPPEHFFVTFEASPARANQIVLVSIRKYVYAVGLVEFIPSVVPAGSSDLPHWQSFCTLLKIDSAVEDFRLALFAVHV